METNATQETQRTHAEALGDPDDFEYADSRAVFRIDDGERHWYVATSAGEALTAHLKIMCPDDDDSDFSVRRAPHNEAISVRLDTPEDANDYPATFQLITPDDPHASHRIRAYAGMWAAHLKAGRMICSSAL